MLHTNKKAGFVTFSLAAIIFTSFFLVWFSNVTGGSIPSFLVSFFNENEKKEYVVELREDGFYPRELNIHQGDTVQFETTRSKPFWPASNLHPTHTIYPEFDPQKPIFPTEQWSFQFDKPGQWKYHDHLFPNYRGDIVVQGKTRNKNGSIQFVASCTDIIGRSEKEQCWDNQLQLTIQNQGLDAAFELFVKLYKTDPMIPKGCHGWAHILGEEAFELFKEDKEVILRKETAYCGYGFFHGFIEKLLQTTDDIKKTREFCVRAAEQLGDRAPLTYTNCIHGIGHGSVEIENPALFGNFQAMLMPGLEICEAIADQPHDLRDCRDGAFNAMSLYAWYQEYGLSIDKEDLFTYCRDQQEEHKSSCYFEFVGSISLATNHNFEKAVQIILSENISSEISVRTISKLAADFMQDDIVNPDQAKNVLGCRRLLEFLQRPCFKGILVGFVAHGQPGIEHIKLLQFCQDSLLTMEERETCYELALYVFTPTNPSICELVEDRYRKYCRS